MLKEQVELMGGDWGEYQQRMLRVLQEQPGDDEDDITAALRMSMDPSYPTVLAKRAKVAVEQNLLKDDAFHKQVATEFSNISPREAFDQWAARMNTPSP